MHNSNKKTVILVCCHKKDTWVSEKDYLPIHVGKALSNENLGIQGDNLGDNISLKNESYCELTAQYWAWKNLSNFDYIGLNHYRRYFDFYSGGKYFSNLKIIKSDAINQYNFQLPDISKLLNKYDIILAKPKVYEYNLKTEYCLSHISEDYCAMKKIVKDFAPDYYEAFKQVFEENNKFSHFNMFIVSNKIFNDYCSWLFALLGQIENELDISHYSAHQKRIFAYMGERFLNIYVVKNNLRVKYYPVLWVNSDMNNNVFIKNLLFHIRAKTAFSITNFHLPKLLKKLLK